MRGKIEQPLGIIVRTEESPAYSGNAGYFHITGTFVSLEDGLVKGFSSSYEPINGLAKFDNLTIRSQGENAHRERMYGFEVEYRSVFTVEERDAAKMLPTLSKINKRLRAFNDTRGHLTTVGQFFGRVAEAVGTKKYPVRFLEATRDGRWLSETEFKYRDIPDGVAWIDSLFRNWQAVTLDAGSSLMNVDSETIAKL